MRDSSMFIPDDPKKSDGSVGVGLMGHSGLGRQRPVILPPSRTEGGRCSVKPASRGLLRSKEILAPNLRSEDISTPDLEWAGQ
ncbi:hypothetical protein AXX17_AT1G43860 [Arabidopsis thaliana]|uniref:Uncharacterized protein n=1 Tax=Arabidopsis thaliana TaxID=3702 RepID=A0A178WL03_ARATH|nr:hypothetical protein AXX17_AT1G43860 [Arabidopsis thaliana]